MKTKLIKGIALTVIAISLIIIGFTFFISDVPDYTVVDKEVKDSGGKSTVRLYTENTDKESIKAIVNEIYNTEEIMGKSASLHAYIHEQPKNDNKFGGLVAMAKYAYSDRGMAQTGVDETGKVFVEFEQ